MPSASRLNTYKPVLHVHTKYNVAPNLADTSPLSYSLEAGAQNGEQIEESVVRDEANMSREINKGS